MRPPRATGKLRYALLTCADRETADGLRELAALTGMTTSCVIRVLVMRALPAALAEERSIAAYRERLGLATTGR